MLSTYDRIMHDTKVTRRLEYTYDNRDVHGLLNEYRATIEALRAKVKELEAGR